jgi:carboxyl-terminal processing protease
MMKYKNHFFVLMPLLFIAFGFYLKAQNEGEDVLLKAVNISLQNAHYDPVELNDQFSERAFNLYLENLDGNKRLLLQEDVDQLSVYKTEIDNQVSDGTYEFFNASLEVIDKRIDETEKYFNEILQKPFNFEIEEEVSFADDLPYAETSEELKDRWRKYLKYSVLTRLYSYKKSQDDAVAKSDTAVEVKSLDSLEAKARRNVLKTHQDWYKRLKKLDRKERLSMYINSITAVYDPHTNYYPPVDKDNFDIQMSGRLEGIGAQLQEKDGYIKITNVIPGGPASLQGDLQANDLILKVAQEGEEPVDVIDWRINDAVQIIRGKKGTKVTLTVKKPDGSIQDITITRDVVVLEETYAKSLIIKDKDNVKTGLIYLPSFYADFRNPRGRFSWKDVKAEIEKLKAESVEGIILDLRNNGGGSLDDVVKMGGLFIDKGPIVQVKEKDRPPHILEDRYGGADWEGALVIMVNEFSASASEILAAAMQDYNRAVIVGSSSTHGKGTVQRFLPLNQTLRSKNLPDLGSVKLTIQKFYRINGDATQLKGVNSDVLLPDNYMYIKTGEKEHDYPMEWDQIQEADYDSKRYSYPKKIVSKSISRVKKNPTFQLIEENARRWERERENDDYTLNFEAYTEEKHADEEEDKKFSSIGKEPIEDFEVTNLRADVEAIEKDEARKKRNEDWIKSTKKDPYVYEALQIIEDWNS